MGSLFRKKTPSTSAGEGWSEPEEERYNREETLAAASRDLAESRLPEAEQGYLKILGKNNEDIEGLRGLASVFQKKGYRQQAITTYNRLLSVDSTDADARARLSEMMRSGG